VHAQAYANIEHIVVDGASIDGTVDLIKEYAERDWVRYISEPDKGIYDAMNKGIKLAKGKYIAFLNSDDFYNDAKGIEESVEHLERSRADFSYAPAVIKFEDGSLFSDHPQCKPKMSNVFFTMPFCHQAMFTKREVMLKENMFDTRYKSAADYDFVVRLCLKKYKSVFVKKKFVTYLFGGVSSTDQENSVRETTEVWRKNFSSIYPISDSVIDAMRKNIYTGKYFDGIPRAFAKRLENFEPYFNYNEYLNYSGKENYSLKIYSFFSKWKDFLKK
jgi:glycosyltransferase involved in cell wall biosynthesis